MKIFLLIHGQDTDSACDTKVKPFAGQQAAWDAMRKEWNEAVTAWGYASKEHGDEDECECRQDAAVIRAGGDVEHWRIEEQELAVPVSVAVEVSGGLVRAVYAKGGDVGADDSGEKAPPVNDAAGFVGNCGDVLKKLTFHNRLPPD